MGRVIKAAGQAEQLRKVGREVEAARAELIAIMAMAAQLRIQAKTEIVDLSLKIAKKVIGTAVSLDPSHLDSIYRGAVSRAGTLAPLSLHVHPEDRAASNLDTIAKERALIIVEDAGIDRSGCKVTYGDAEIDATLETALGALRGAMMGWERD